MDDPQETHKSFWRKINKNGPLHPVLKTRCWIWTAATNGNYGVFFTPKPKRKQWSSHRFSWHLHSGSIPKGLCVLHHCDNPLCVRPLHLFLGTKMDNREDSKSKDRHNRGERNGSATLTNTQIKEIRSRYRSGWGQGSHSAIAIARDYNVSRELVYFIIRRKLWKHI